MDLSTLLAFLVIVTTVVGWLIVHIFDKHRDNLNKKKEIRINFLINAWRLLESASNQENNALVHNTEIAIADIQLFGSKRQIELAQKIAIDMATSKQADTLDLLKNLRADLRKELKLEVVPDNFKFLRIKKNS
ncbi:hypothetical protein EZS27_011916 [termite gut metagenome]|uniref:Uncharacterized protein n=1 Tax=termite gut metagenome TaxID=433724 RepID=A0A5J4S1X1_9ZZZZ